MKRINNSKIIIYFAAGIGKKHFYKSMRLQCIILLVFIGLCCGLSALAQSNDVDTSLINVWKLDSVDIKELTVSGNAVTIPYDTLAFANTIDCIYPQVELSAERCVFGYDTTTVRPDTFDIKDAGKLKFRFGGSEESIEFDAFIQDKTMYLRRWYVGKDDATFKVVELKYIIR